MGRKSREKRERTAISKPSEPLAEAALTPQFAATIETTEAPHPTAAGRRRQPRKARAVGARVARVAADDDTWEAFKELCGSTPASVRLGQLVAAEVERSRRPGSDPDAVAAIDEIRVQLDALEAAVRATGQR